MRRTIADTVRRMAQALRPSLGLYRDGYNKTNLDVGLGSWFRARFTAVDEPWEGPGLRLIVELGQNKRKFGVIHINWGDA